MWWLMRLYVCDDWQWCCVYDDCVWCCVCAESSTLFSSEADVNEYQRDDQSAMYLCSVCEKQFTTKARLTEHTKRHTADNVYQCTQCGKRYSCRAYLGKHMNIHQRKYRCKECDKCCQDAYELAGHKRTHSGEKPFSCGVCDKRYKLRVNLVEHFRKHSGDKPFKCHACEKAFSRSDCLRKHMMRFHAGETVCCLWHMRVDSEGEPSSCVGNGLVTQSSSLQLWLLGVDRLSLLRVN